ncbi:MAG: S9 family peptidase [Gemmatimonadota bacterium]|nr:S9 family peptidase [Gemmatimonadota bacterium]
MSSPIKPEHTYDLVDVSDVEIAGDGSAVVFVRQEINRETMKRESRIVMQSLAGGAAVDVTEGPQDGAPRLSPDGRTLAFMRSGEDDKRQVWVMPVGGNGASQLTTLPDGVKDLAWSPDGREFVVVSRVDPDRAPDDHDEETMPTTRVARRVRYRDDGDGWRGDAFSQLFLVDAATGRAEQITDGEGNHGAPAWSPDGSRIAFVTDRVEDRDFVRGFEVHVMELAGRTSRCWSGGLSRAESAAWSPDGTRLAVAGSHDADVWDSRQSWLYVLAEAGKPVCVAGDAYSLVQPLASRGWTPDGGILFIGDREGESFLCRVDASVSAPRTRVLNGGGREFTGLSVDGRGAWAAAVTSSPDCPCDVAVLAVNAKRQRVVTAVNAGFLKAHPAARMEKLVFKRKGEAIEARVLFPDDFNSAKSYPLVLDIHGGPHGRFSDSYDVTHQILAGAGYIVLAVNPRGSSSYGPGFLKAVLGDWGGEDFLDLMAGVDLLCERPYVDSDRLGVHGYSYGGFMSSWIVGHDHRFKAAVIGAPCINLHSMYGTSDIGVSFGENQWRGSVLENVEALVRRSPLTYAQEVRTPVLLMHGEEDYRCPIEQAEQFFVALKRQGKTAEFVRFPKSSHGFRKSGHPALHVEYLDRMVSWLAQYV